ncbi:hypothetical protein XELAEV_18031600mg [Xenopus laevis]|uniref:Uncharacterized protein n=1 Tax=Xenopus laevis TaxID=8355 RepID=A0A974HFU9_XENLA|nr:hypothetical protein XELAEV_18031600mg [Xenopus laevis]
MQPSPRIGNTDWCICDNCVAMPTDLESVCCKETDNIINVMDEEFSCILQHTFFYDYCQHRERIEINLKMIEQQRTPPHARDLNLYLLF